MNQNLKEALKEAMIENTLSKKDDLGTQPFPKSIFIIPSIFFILILICTYLLNPHSNIFTGPYGKIKLPKKGQITGIEVKVVGETRNIKGVQYIWLAVDKPEIDLC